MKSARFDLPTVCAFPPALYGLIGLMLIVGCASRKQPPVIAPITHPSQVERISTAVHFPRGLVMHEGQLYALARGRVRESGGVDGSINDHAGTIYSVDPTVAESIATREISDAVRHNAQVFAAPTEPPFKLFDPAVNPATNDRATDRPYCGLRYDPITQNFYICAFSGIDKPEGGKGNFSKNTNDAVLRFDTRSMKWHDVERHNLEAGGNYPHHDPASHPPPHGWLNGPDNCLVVGNWLYCVSKDNSLLVRYDLSEIAKTPDSPAPPSAWVMDHRIKLRGQGRQELFGQSMLAYRDGWLYIGYRTSSVIVRIKLDGDNLPVQPIVGEMIARFDPYDPKTRKSANLTDMVFGPEGDLYVVSAQPARVYRIGPDPKHVFDGRTGATPAWADLSKLTNNPKMKSENLLVDDAGRVYVTSGDAYAFQYGSGGTIYRINP